MQDASIVVIVPAYTCCVYKTSSQGNSVTGKQLQWNNVLHLFFCLRCSEPQLHMNCQNQWHPPIYSSHGITHLWKLLRQNKPNNKPKLGIFFHISLSLTTPQWVLSQPCVFYFQHYHAGPTTCSLFWGGSSQEDPNWYFWIHLIPP